MDKRTTDTDTQIIKATSDSRTQQPIQGDPMADCILPYGRPSDPVDLMTESDERSLRSSMAPFSPRPWVVYYIQGTPGGLAEDTVKQIQLFLASSRMFLVHIPDMLSDKLMDQIAYNFPWTSPSVEKVTEMAFYKAAAEHLDITLDKDSRYFVRYNDKGMCMDYCRIDGTDTDSVIGCLEAFLRADTPIPSNEKDSKKKRSRPSGIIRWFKSAKCNLEEQSGSLYDDFNEESDSTDSTYGEFSCDMPAIGSYQPERTIGKDHITPSAPPVSMMEETIVKPGDPKRDFFKEFTSGQTPADKLLPEELAKAEAEARALIRSLLLNDFSRDIIKSWLYEDVVISRVHIDRKFRIFLTDYHNMEVSMTPLEKTVWLFYLNHPEGVAFKDLPDHEKEITRIYSKLAKSGDMESIRKSARSLCNPFEESICQKVAKVKAAFLKVIPEEIARHYYISGQMGMPKTITIDRSKITADASF